MGQFFGPETQGIDVVKAFPDRVRKRICTHISQSIIQLTRIVLLTGIDKRELAVTTAEALAQGEAAALILLGPSQSETQPQIDEINLKYAKTKVIYITADFASLASVREAADTINKLDVPIDGIIGYPTVIAAEWATTKDGIESHFQINYLSHFLLVNLILGRMPDASRVVMISSSIRPDSPALKFDNPNFSVSSLTQPCSVGKYGVNARVGRENLSSPRWICAVDVRQYPVYEMSGDVVCRPVYGCFFS